MTPPIVAVTMGDPAGIGTEVALKALVDPATRRACRPVLVGDRRVVAAANAAFGTGLAVRAVASVAEARFEGGAIDLIDLGNLDPAEIVRGVATAATGRAMVACIRRSAALALAGEVDAVASAPVNKEAMHAAGFAYSGQTDIYAEAAGVRDYFTVLTGGRMRVFLASSHVSLRAALDLIAPPRIASVIRIADRALRDLWRIARPRIGVAGVNPHAGEGGIFGREEADVLAPVVASLAAEGIDVVGPLPADSLYAAADRGAFDGIVGMYHDQGVIPLKRHGYVTVVAGLPFVRTTAGHGTAYDIAGRGIADPSVMARAIQVAAELAALRRDAAGKRKGKE